MSTEEIETFWGSILISTARCRLSDVWDQRPNALHWALRGLRREIRHFVKCMSVIRHEKCLRVCKFSLSMDGLSNLKPGTKREDRLTSSCCGWSVVDLKNVDRSFITIWNWLRGFQGSGNSAVDASCCPYVLNALPDPASKGQWCCHSRSVRSHLNFYVAHKTINTTGRRHVKLSTSADDLVCDWFCLPLNYLHFAQCRAFDSECLSQFTTDALSPSECYRVPFPIV